MADTTSGVLPGFLATKSFGGPDPASLSRRTLSGLLDERYPPQFGGGTGAFQAQHLRSWRVESPA
jgi:hypothetical protein